MSSVPSHVPPMPNGQAAENLRVRLRPDLIIQPQFYEGMTHYVIKDPIALKYFRFKAEEYFLLQMLDGKHTLIDIKRAFEAKYRPQTISIEDLTRFAAQLHEAGIGLIDSPDQAKALIRRRRKRQWRKVLQAFASVLYIKVPLFDPERLLNWMLPYFRWLYSTWFNIFSVTMMLSAILLVISQWDTFVARLPDYESFFNWRTIVYFWCSLAIVKVIHEFGHGLTAKYFGGEVHEMGMLMLVLTPCLYCDVTDSWLLPNKWHRIWISAAGIYVECFLASIATFVWWNTEPGLLNSLCLATMFICSVNTILFNANPLLRYDGYYVMSDWLEIPNLRIKSTQFFTYLIQDKVLGLEVPVQSYLPKARRSLFVTYAVTSYLYRWVVIFSITLFLYGLLKPYKLGSISAMLAIASVVPMLIIPLYKSIKFIRTPGRMRKVKKARAASYAIGLVTVVALILMIPTPLRVQGTLVLMVAKPEKVYAEVPGRLTDLKVRDGEWVKAGTLIASLSNYEKMIERSDLQMQHDVNIVKASYYSRSSDNASRGLSRVHMNMAHDLEPTLTKVNEQIAKLNLTAPRDGMVMGVPHRETVGSWIQPDKPFCEVGDPRRLEAHLIMDQGDIDLVKVGRKSWVKIYGESELTWTRRVSEVATRNREEVPPELSNLAGGEIATKPDQKTGQIKPLSSVYEVIIPIDNDALTLHPGQRGFAKIDGGLKPLWWWLWRTITKNFHFSL